MKETDKTALFQLKTEKDLTSLKIKPGEIAGLIAGYRNRTETIKADKRYTEQYRQKLLAKAFDETQTELERLKIESKEAASRLAGVLEEVQHDQVDTQQAILNELQSQRAWNRVSRLLDAGADWNQVIEQNKSDFTTLQVLKSELPAYITAKHQRENYNILPGILASIEEKEFPLLPPHRQQARLLESELSAGSYQINMGIAHFEAELAGKLGKTPITVIPAWEKGKAIKVADHLVSVNDATLVGVE